MTAAKEGMIVRSGVGGINSTRILKCKNAGFFRSRRFKFLNPELTQSAKAVQVLSPTDEHRETLFH